MKSSIFKIIDSTLRNDSVGSIESIKESLYNKLAEKIINYKKLVKETYLSEQVAFDKLSEIVKRNQKAVVNFDDGSTLVVDVLTAKAILNLEDKLSQPAAKDKLKRMVNKNKFEFMKAANFALEKTTFKV